MIGNYLELSSTCDMSILAPSFDYYCFHIIYIGYSTLIGHARLYIIFGMWIFIYYELRSIYGSSPKHYFCLFFNINLATSVYSGTFHYIVAFIWGWFFHMTLCTFCGVEYCFIVSLYAYEFITMGGSFGQ